MPPYQLDQANAQGVSVQTKLARQLSHAAALLADALHRNREALTVHDRQLETV